MSDESDVVARIYMHRDILEYRAVRRVVEANVLKFDVALEAVEVDGVGSVSDLRNGVDDLKHTLRAVRGVGDHVRELCKEVERAEYHADIAYVRREFTVVMFLFMTSIPPRAPNCLARQTYEQTYEREYRQRDKVDLQIRLRQLFSVGVETVGFLGFL